MLGWIFGCTLALLGCSDADSEADCSEALTAVSQSANLEELIQRWKSSEHPCAGAVLIKAYRLTHRNEQGLVLVDRLLAVSPRAPGVSREAAEFLADTGQVTRALQVLDEALLPDARDPASILLRARLRHAVGNYEGALGDCEHLAQANAGSVGSEYLRAISLVSLGREAEGEAALVALVEPQLRSRLAQLELGRLRSRQGRWQDSISILREYVAAKPRDVAAVYALGTALLRGGMPQEGRRALARFQELNRGAEAEKDALQTVANNPRNVIAMLDCAAVLLDQAAWIEARLLLDRLAGVDDVPQGRYQELVLRFARHLRKSGKIRSALKRLQSLGQVDTPAAKLELAECWNAAGKHTRALQVLESIQGPVREEPGFLLLRTELGARHGWPWERLAAGLRMAVEGSEFSLDAILTWVDCGRGLGAAAAALQQLEVWRAQAPQNPRLSLALGVFHTGGPQHAKAREFFLRALELDPFYAPNYELYANWLEQAGKANEAASQRQRARELRYLGIRG